MNIFNFIETYKIPENVCDDLIQYYKKNKEYKNKINLNGKVCTEVTFFNNSQSKIILTFFKLLSEHIQKYINKYKIQNNIQSFFGNNIQYYKPKESFNSLHYERNPQYPKRQLVYMLYLNTIKDNGGTQFPFQKKIVKAIKGNLLIWPADFTHPHLGIVSNTEDKYIVTGWMEMQ